MKEQEIIEGNKLIAEFMGASFHEDTPMILKKHVVSPAGNAIKCADKLRYNSSWDWLMPVVEKIANLDNVCAFRIGYSGMVNLGMRSKYVVSQIDDWIDREFASNSGQQTLIECTYQSVVDFIKWYNNQPNQ